MKFLLVAVNAKYIHSNPAIYSLRAFAGEEMQPYIELAEYTINQSLTGILADIYRRNPDAIGFSCYIWNWRMIRELLPELQKVLPETDVWLGGPEVTYDADAILKKYPNLRGIIIGEGEETFRELLLAYLQGRPWQDIAGLCLPEGYTAVRSLADMNKLPFLYHDLKPFTNKIIYYETSRGCPYRCSYCLSSIDKTVRLRDISVVKKELQFFLDNKVAQVKFVDRTFNCNHEHAMAIWQYLYEHDNGVTNFHFEISADILREDEISLLNKLRPGQTQLEIGVQSTNEETIRAIHRVMNVDKLEQIVASIHKGHNIHQHLDLIAGLPYEDYESFGHSFDRVYAMKPEQLQLGFLKVLKGSEMSERAEEFGIRYLEEPPYEVLYTRWLPYPDVLRLKQIEEMVELYYNSNQFTHTLPFLVRAFPGPFAMFEALADFYAREGFFTNSPARAYRYQVLLRFAEETDGQNAAIYRELLTYDLYLRENAKSRPDFAVDYTGNEAVRKSLRNFYRQEAQERKYLLDYAGYDSRQLSKMTHMEPFSYPVWDERFLNGSQTVQESAKPAAYVLFDYKNRDPLTYEARTVRFSEDSLRENCG